MGANSGFEGNRPDIFEMVEHLQDRAREAGQSEETPEPAVFDEDNEALPTHFPDEAAFLAHPRRWLKFRGVLRVLKGFRQFED